MKWVVLKPEQEHFATGLGLDPKGVAARFAGEDYVTLLEFKTSRTFLLALEGLTVVKAIETTVCRRPLHLQVANRTVRKE